MRLVVITLLIAAGLHAECLAEEPTFCVMAGDSISILTTCQDCGENTGDCGEFNTVPGPYIVNPLSSTRTIPVVWHIILGPNGEGDVSDLVEAQMELINNSFAAMPNTPFENWSAPHFVRHSLS